MISCSAPVRSERDKESGVAFHNFPIKDLILTNYDTGSTNRAFHLAF